MHDTNEWDPQLAGVRDRAARVGGPSVVAHSGFLNLLGPAPAVSVAQPRTPADH